MVERVLSTLTDEEAEVAAQIAAEAEKSRVQAEAEARAREQMEVKEVGTAV